MEIVEFINKFRQSAQQTPNKVTIVDEKASCKTTFADFWTFVQLPSLPRHVKKMEKH